MVKSIAIHQVHTDTLSCEPLLERTANGELLCVCQCDGVDEPAPENRVYVFHSKDNGKTWTKKERLYPEDGNAVYCTELSVFGDEITAYLSVHNGRFLDWKCIMMKSFDNGYTWENHGAPPFFPEYTFTRATFCTSDGRILVPYQHYPVTKEERDRVYREEEDKVVGLTRTPYCESGVLESTDGGKTYQKYPACRMDMSKTWIWTEPTLAEVSKGKLAMLMRQDGSGALYRCDSEDGGRTWGEHYRTDIPNPSNKPRLFQLPDGRIALIHTPSKADGSQYPLEPGVRFPLELWISSDGMKSWSSKTQLTDFPGDYSYTDGLYEDGHLRFVIEHNRHTILYFDVALK